MTKEYNSFYEIYSKKFQYREGDAYVKARLGEESSYVNSICLNFKKGGRINRRFGSPEEGEGSGVMEMLSVDVDAGNDEEEENMEMAGIRFT